MELKELREKWEDGLCPVTQLSTAAPELFVVGKDVEYSCLRYFKTGGEWVVSVDLRDVDPDQALAWIADCAALALGYAFERGAAAGRDANETAEGS